MTAVYTLDQILSAMADADLLPEIERGFVLYSEGRVTVPPVGELLFREPPGDVHIKYGYIQGGDFYLVKLASGFYRNVALGLNPTPGLMIVARQDTGQIEAVLLEEGFLTNLRTALAGAAAAKHLAPHPVRRIGIFGTGVQGRMQLEQLKGVTACRDVIVWGRQSDALDAYKRSFAASDFNIETTLDAEAAARDSDLIVTATPAEQPFLMSHMVSRGTHITAVGADTECKRELGPGVIADADLVVADSISQCRMRGEIHHALAEKTIDVGRIVELGDVIRDPRMGRSTRDQVSVADLTGVAVQDIVIASAALKALRT